MLRVYRPSGKPGESHHAVTVSLASTENEGEAIVPDASDLAVPSGCARVTVHRKATTPLVASVAMMLARACPATAVRSLLAVMRGGWVSTVTTPRLTERVLPRASLI